MIHVNDFGCLAHDLNLALFNMVIFLSTFKRRLLSHFITSEEAFNLAKVANFWPYQSEHKYRNTSSIVMIVAMFKQIFSVYINLFC